MYTTDIRGTNKLQYIDLVSRASIPELRIDDETAEEQKEQFSTSVLQGWDSAVFSNRSDESLHRYFRYIQTELIEGIAAATDPETIVPLLDLMTALTSRHARYADAGATTPKVFVNHFVKAFRADAERIVNAISESLLDTQLKNCLIPYFDEFLNVADESTISLGSLIFFKKLCISLDRTPWRAHDKIENQVANILEKLNFNHLGFFAWQQEKLSIALPEEPGARLLALRQVIVRYEVKPDSSPYDSSWPDIQVMLSGWLTEELRFTEKLLLNQNINPVPVQKLPLNVSVAHLALIIRMFVDEKLIAQENLSMIFHFISRHFRTKRQECISPGSFGKEYYSAGQVTAAVVRDYFLRMARRIDHQFFPVWFVIGAATLAALNIG